MQSLLAVTSRALAKANAQIVACGYKPKLRAIEIWAKRLSETSTFVTDSATASDYLALSKINGTDDHGWAVVNHGTGPFGERFVAVIDCNGVAVINTDL